MATSTIREAGKSYSSGLLGYYKADANTVGGDPATGYVRWDNATQINAANITIDHVTEDGVDIDLFLSLILEGDRFAIQDKDNSDNFQIWQVSGAPVHSGATYWTIPVTLLSSGGTGTTNFSNNTKVFTAVSHGATSPVATGTGLDLVSYTFAGGF